MGAADFDSRNHEYCLSNHTLYMRSGDTRVTKNWLCAGNRSESSRVDCALMSARMHVSTTHALPDISLQRQWPVSSTPMQVAGHAADDHVRDGCRIHLEVRAVPSCP